ncbi:hypothetical protein ACFV6F_02940 [Kitasatospora phosalacinea]|uniref:hypothetical protein n=1 Tax=Kitasatospora phosalacinea TaxID=2065 RepID=UPI00366A0C45
MSRLTRIADRLVAKVAPKGAAAACSGCQTYQWSGPCHGGYIFQNCCYAYVNGVCSSICGDPYC